MYSNQLNVLLIVFILAIAAPLSNSTFLDESSSTICTPTSYSLASSMTTASLLILLTLSISPTSAYQSKSNNKDDNEVYSDSSNHHQMSGGKTKSSPLEDFITGVGQPPKRPENMTCHVCHSEHQPDCFNISALSMSAEYNNGVDMNGNNNWMSERSEDFKGYPKTCDSEHSVCMVRKFAFTVSNGTGIASAMKTFAIKRNCTSKLKCENGCVVMGERTRIYVCSQCCSTPLCNIGNTAAAQYKTRWLSWIQAINISSFLLIAIVIS